MRFGTSKRFLPGVGESRGTPGPKYNPNLRPEVANPEKYSFGFRRELAGYSVLNPLIATGIDVGPGKYHTKNPVAPNTSQQPNQPVASFPEHMRFVDGRKNITVNETYEIYKSVSNQVRSQKKSEPKIHFTRSKREAKVGQFRDGMATQARRVVIPMPKI
jgi:hypothetical protein